MNVLRIFVVLFSVTLNHLRLSLTFVMLALLLFGTLGSTAECQPAPYSPEDNRPLPTPTPFVTTTTVPPTSTTTTTTRVTTTTVRVVSTPTLPRQTTTTLINLPPCPSATGSCTCPANTSPYFCPGLPRPYMCAYNCNAQTGLPVGQWTNNCSNVLADGNIGCICKPGTYQTGPQADRRNYCCPSPGMSIVNGVCQFAPPSTTSTTTTSTTTTSTTTVTTTTRPIACEYSTVWAAHAQGINRGLNYSTVGGDTAVPSCIMNMITQAYNECRSIPTLLHQNLYWGISIDAQNLVAVDDCVVWKLFGGRFMDSALINAGDYRYANFGAQYGWANFATRNEIRVHMPAGEYCVNTGCHYYPDSYLLYDATDRLFIKQDANGNCTAVSAPPAGAQTCYAGTINWYNSPISLLFDESLDIESDLKIVLFPLDLSNLSSPWSIWKASSKAPLLVYDPEHTGKITSATQLFGDWTFGGQKQAMASVSVNDANLLSTKWNNGYEALATLDVNSDGKVSGTELAPLALWFDENRNGVSEPGEVRRLEEVNVITLYYQPNRLEKGTNNLYADQGFEHVVDGKVITGRSVDWRSDVAKSKGELVNRHLASALGCPKGPTVNLSSYLTDFSNIAINAAINFMPGAGETKSDDVLSTPVKLIINENNISGLWQWKGIENHSGIEGFLGFSDHGDGKLRGHTYSVFGVKDKSLDFSKIFSAIRFEGKKSKVNEKEIEISFTVKPDDTSVIINKATYDIKKQTITGQSLAKVSIGTKAIDLNYSWVATRYPTSN